MHKAENRVGRLVEVKLASPLSLDEVQEFVKELTTIITRIPDKYVGAVDLLGAHVFPPAVADSLVHLLSAASSHVERTAMLIGESAIFSLQVERVIRNANNQNRRVFRRREELEHWLGEVLNADERVRLKQFLWNAAVPARGLT
jgi:hypothetical protein